MTVELSGLYCTRELSWLVIAPPAQGRWWRSDAGQRKASSKRQPGIWNEWVPAALAGGSFTQDSYSYFNATVGSTRVAFLAGTKKAANATNPNSPAIEAIIHGSLALTSNNILDIILVSASAPTNPIVIPRSVNFRPRRQINPKTSDVCAPSAIRIPISCVRLVTM